MERLTRKENRLKNYTYSTANAYFITICTNNRNNLFWDSSSRGISCPEDIKLSQYGKVVDQAISNIPKYYPAITVDQYVIMPDHVHLLLQINTDEDGRPMESPKISTVVQQLKGVVSKQAGFPVWQKGFQDHIIRGENDYREIYKYIENNPQKWAEDKFFTEI